MLTMNRKQKIVLWISIAVTVVIGLFPPWVAETQVTYKFAKDVMGDELIPDDPSYYPKYSDSIKYSFILKPPRPILYAEPDPVTKQTSDSYEVYFVGLGLQWIAVAFITYMLIDHFKGIKEQEA